MAFLFHENFEAGTLGGFTRQIDTLGKISFPDHNDGLAIPPWRGGYVMKVDLDRGTDIAYVEQSTAVGVAAGQIRYCKMHFYLSKDFWMSPGTSVEFLRFGSGDPLTSSTIECAVAVARDTFLAERPLLGVVSPDFSNTLDGLYFETGRWNSLEGILYHTVGGVSRFYLIVGDNILQVNGFTYDTITHVRLGTLFQSPNLRGTLYFDDFIFDSARVKPPADIPSTALSGESLLFTKTSYAFVGPGVLRGATLISGGNDNAVDFFDTDKLPVPHQDLKGALKCSSPESKDSLIKGVRFQRGCYMVISGTDPQVLVHYGQIGEPAAQSVMSEEEPADG